MVARSVCLCELRGGWFRTARVVGAAAMFALNGCFAAVAGVHQDMRFRSELPEVDIRMDDKMCRIPCTLTIRRQWGTFNLQATHNGRIVAEGPIYRREEYEGDRCKDEMSGLAVAAFIDGLLIVPGIIDLSTGIIVWHPETVVIQQGGYVLEDACFEKPVAGGPK